MTKVKFHIIFAAFAVSILFLAPSCNNFLNIRPEGSMASQDMDYTKAENIFKPVSAAYASLRSYSAHAFSYICMFEIPSDNADKGSTPEDNPDAQSFQDFALTPSTSLLNESWIGFYDIISSANSAIYQMDLFEKAMQSEDNKEYARQCKGEAKFIRAYAYYQLARAFGRVPLIDTLVSSEALAKVKQAEVQEVWDFIEKDLTDAILVLPESYSKQFAGRVTKYSAHALKAKVHLYQQEWNDAAINCDEVIKSRKYSLVSDFRSVFSVENENNSESLFEVGASTLGKTDGDAPYMEYAYVQGPRGNTPGNMQGWGFCVPSQDLIDFFTARGEDERAKATFLYRGTTTPEGDEIKASCTNPVYNGKVYTPSVYNKWNYNGYGRDHNLRLLRYSDVLLIYEEALANGASALTLGELEAINMVRDRVNLDPLDSVTNEIIWDERRAEFAMEEDRYFDLIRTGQASTVLASHGFKAGKHEHYPIPSNQIQLNSNLTQNPGW